MRTTAPGRLVRSRQSLIAAVTGTAVVVLVALGLFLPLAGLLIGVTASSAGLVPFPGLSVTAVTLVGIVGVAALLLFAVTRRRPASAWAAAVFAVLVSLAVTAFPVIGRGRLRGTRQRRRAAPGRPLAAVHRRLLTRPTSSRGVGESGGAGIPAGIR